MAKPKQSQPEKNQVLQQDKIDNFNSLLSIATYECRQGIKPDCRKLKQAMKEAHPDLEEAVQLDNLESATAKEAEIALKKLDAQINEKLRGK